MDPNVGDGRISRRLGRYTLVRSLGAGGMAELFLAYLPGPGGFKKFVALKQILPDVKADDSFVKMFLDEARITAALSHANIAQVFELAEDPDSHEPMLGLPGIWLPVWMKVTAGSGLMASVWTDLMTAISSAILAVCCNSSLNQMPD